MPLSRGDVSAGERSAAAGRMGHTLLHAAACAHLTGPFYLWLCWSPGERACFKATAGSAERPECPSGDWQWQATGLHYPLLSHPRRLRVSGDAGKAGVPGNAAVLYASSRERWQVPRVTGRGSSRRVEGAPRGDVPLSLLMSTPPFGTYCRMIARAEAPPFAFAAAT